MIDMALKIGQYGDEILMLLILFVLLIAVARMGASIQEVQHPYDEN